MTHDAPTTDAAAGRLPGRSGQIPDAQGTCVEDSIAAVCGEQPDWSDRFIEAIRSDVKRNRIRRAFVLHPTEVGAGAIHEISRRLALALEQQNPDYLIDVAKFAMWAWIRRTPAEVPQ